MAERDKDVSKLVCSHWLDAAKLIFASKSANWVFRFYQLFTSTFRRHLDSASRFSGFYLTFRNRIRQNVIFISIFSQEAASIGDKLSEIFEKSYFLVNFFIQRFLFSFCEVQLILQIISKCKSLFFKMKSFQYFVLFDM